MATVKKLGKPGAAPATPVTPGVIEGEVVPDGVDSKTGVGTGTTAVAVRPVPGTPAPAAGPRFTDDDNIDFAEMRLPRLGLAQGVGELGNTHPPGTFVLDGTIPLCEAPERNEKAIWKHPPIRLVIVGFRATRWAEKTGTAERGRIYDTEQEVRDNGGTTNYAEKGTKPLFGKLSQALVLVQMPANLDAADFATDFPYEADGKRYAMATWNIGGAAFTRVVPSVKTWRKMKQFRNAAGVNSYRNFFVDLNPAFAVFQGGNSSYVPVVRRTTDLTSDAVRAIVEEFVPLQTAQ